MKYFSISLILMVSLLVLGGCKGGSVLWQGKKPTDKIGKVAYDACACIEETFESVGIDVKQMAKQANQMLEDAKKMDEGKMGDAEFDAKYKDILQDAEKLNGMDRKSLKCLGELERAADNLSKSENQEAQRIAISQCPLLAILGVMRTSGG